MICISRLVALAVYLDVAVVILLVARLMLAIQDDAFLVLFARTRTATFALQLSVRLSTKLEVSELRFSLSLSNLTLLKMLMSMSTESPCKLQLKEFNWCTCEKRRKSGTLYAMLNSYYFLRNF